MEDLIKKIAEKIIDLGNDNTRTIRLKRRDEALKLLEEIVPKIDSYLQDQVDRVRAEAEREVEALSDDCA